MALFRTGLYVKNHAVEQVQVASTPIASFNGNVTGVYIPEIIAEIVARQAGSGTPAPDNIMPFIGVSKCNVCNTPMPVSQLWTIDSSFNGHVEFNQLVQNRTSNHTLADVTFTYNSDGNYWVANGTANNTTGGLACFLDIPSIPTHKYIFGLSGNTQLKTYDYQAFSIIQAKTGLYMYSGNANKTIMQMRVVVENGVTYDNEKFYGQAIDLTQMFGNTIADYIYSLEQATAGAGVAFFRSIYPNDYYAYDTGTDEMVGSREGNTYTIQLGQTVYACYLNATTGLLTIFGKYLEFNAATYYGIFGVDDAPLFYVDITGEGIKRMENTNREGILISNMLTKTTGSGAQRLKNYEIRTDADNVPSKFYFRIDDCTSQADIDTFFADKTLQVVAELITPITVQLSPIQVEQLLANNVCADTGNVAVKFYNVIR